VTAASFSPDGLLTAAGDRFGSLFLWETNSGHDFLTLRGHAKAITMIAWLAKTDGLVTAGEDGVVQVWDLHTGKVRSRWDAHPGGVLAVDSHPSGGIASVGRDRRVKVWDPHGKLVADLGPTADQASRVAWTADAHSLISGDCSGEVRLWNLEKSTSTSLPIPVARQPATLALIVPSLRPARPFVTSLTATMAAPLSAANRKEATSTTTEDLQTALDAARAAASAAERTVATLSRLAPAQTRLHGEAVSRGPVSTPAIDPLAAATSALASIQAALDAEPGDPALTRAFEETKRAVQLLQRKQQRRGSDRISSTAER
jgi:hypothetical protein